VPTGRRRLVRHRSEPRDDELGVALAGDDAPHARLAAKVADQLDDRPECDPVAVGEAAGCDHGRLGLEPPTQLCREPRLPDPGRADDRHAAARAALDRCVERFAQTCELLAPADERRIETPVADAVRDHVVTGCRFTENGVGAIVRGRGYVCANNVYAHNHAPSRFLGRGRVSGNVGA
jgi:hypothetical protein